MSWHFDQPFNALPPRPPALQPPSTLLLEATAALARADEAAKSIPGPQVLAAAIPVLEAKASSEIENVITTSDELFREVAGVGNATPATVEALRARTALVRGVELITHRPLSTPTVLGIASEVMGHDVQVRRGSGVSIGRPDGSRVYTPPEGHALVSSLLASWAEYVHDESVDPLSRMALSHYQFEAIHPFHDGNGRTGRVLNQLLLLESGLLTQPVLYLSGVINDRKQQYYECLRSVTADGAWAAWLEFMLLAVRDGALWSLDRAARVRLAYEEVAAAVDTVLPSGVSTKFVDALFTNAYITIPDVVGQCSVSRQTASTWLRRLVGTGLLLERKAGRHKVFINRPFHAALLDD